MAKLTVAVTALLLGCILESVAAAAPVASPKQVMAHHIAVVKNDDVDGVMADYASDAVLVTPTETYIGAAGIRRFFKQLAAEHRNWTTYIVTQEVKAAGVVLQRDAKSGRVEVFVVRHGKIAFQALPP